MYIKRLLILFFVLMPCLAEGETFMFKDWGLVCDNTRTCYAVGYPHDSSEQFSVSVLLTRKAGPLQTVGARLRTNSKVYPQHLKINGRDIGVLANPEEDGAVTLNENQTSELIRALARGGKIIIVDDKNQIIELSDQGSTAVLLKMDEYQGRLGTQGALIRKGNRSESAVLEALPPPILRIPALPALRDDDAKIAEDTDLLNDLRETDQCDLLKKYKTISFSIYRLSSEELMISAPCWETNNMVRIAYWVLNAEPPFNHYLAVDAASGYRDGQIYSYQKYNYQGNAASDGECWWRDEWSWNGQSFVATNSTSTEWCKGPTSIWVIPTLVTDVIRTEGMEK